LWRQTRIEGWHAMPMFEQRFSPLLTVQARHCRLTSAQTWGDASISARIVSIVAFPPRQAP
jgi:hypothetical protein